MSNKIGLGIVTCNRPDFLKKVVDSLECIPQDKLAALAICNDGSEILDYDFSHIALFQNKQNIGVGKSKNKLMRYLLNEGCDHIFIMEDDILIRNSDVFDAYITARNITGIQHFNFGYHGPANKAGISGGIPRPRYVIDYGDLKIAINQHSVGAFCYYTREVLETVGLIDEEFHNAFEHVEHDYRIAKAGFCTPYWNWPDLSNSTEYLEEVECSEKSSSIRPRSDWQDNIQKGAILFQKKHGVLPAWQNAVPDSTLEEVKNTLKAIHTKHSKQ